MRIQAPEIGFREFHEDLVAVAWIAAVLELVRFGDGVRVWIIRVRPWQHLLHLERLPRTASDGRLGPLLDRFARFAPVLLIRIPGALVLEPQRHQPQSRYVEPRRFDHAGQIGMARIAPLLARLDHGDLPGHEVPETVARRVIARSPVTSRQRAALSWTDRATNSMGPRRSRSVVEALCCLWGRLDGSASDGSCSSPSHLRYAAR
jgi:hypothetical protein